ncbi:Ras-related protein RABF2a [Tritrichomonas foetus]|uniref:Ras-related protein RABF2a n=1 Tax=Tritrichomonas foetus TaxID=1144522 RepID=A0A1J4JU96_9EUKA|nr:Ras-related protein RABF2a [Tritrichomonas foetus]|eukprot:OHT02571.1 Ras-related protein RABF2a [Tritrichomonas foetus]
MKVVVIGDTQVGKTCIVTRLINGAFSEDMNATIGAAFQTATVVTETSTVSLQIWDTSGQEKYRALAPMYYQGSKAALLCFDITSQISFKSAERWYDELMMKAPQNIKVVLVGNKSDLEEKREVSKEEAENFVQKHNLPFYIECSAKTGDNVSNLFQKVAEFQKKFGDRSENATIKVIDDVQTKKKCC